MVVPTPLVALNGTCSIQHDNTLYVYSPGGFQSIALEEGAEWKELSAGLSVTGGVCVKGGIEGDNSQTALYIVGGSTAWTVDYPGVQRYSFANQSWENMTPADLVTQNRQNHAAVYLNASSSILVYAGSQDGDSNPSTQTFTISTISPYSVQSYESDGAPPVVQPVLLQWNESSALMAGGDTTNTELYTFSPSSGWQNLGASLSEGMASIDTMQSVLLTGSDGSKILETFDLSSSPNTVTSTVLAGAGGSVLSQTYAIGTTSTSRKERATITKRDFSLDSFPTYNGSLASDSTRTQFTLAQGTNGLVTIAGGSSSANDSLCIFNSSENSWVDTTELFEGKSSSVSHTTTSATATSSASSAASSTSAATALDSGSASSTKLKTILGAVLGAGAGLIAILILILFLLRYHRKKSQTAIGNQKRRSSEYVPDSKSRLSFQDQGLQPLKPAAMPMGRGPVPSTDSWAILAARANGAAPPVTPTHETFGHSTLRSRSPLGTAGTTPTFVGSQTSPREKSDLYTSGYEEKANKKMDRRTNEGWDKYFQENGTTTDLAGLHSDRSTYASFETKSDYRSSAWPGYFAQPEQQQEQQQPKSSYPSAEVAPLQLPNRFSGQEHFNHVPAGTPTTTHSSFNDWHVQDGYTAKISSGDSVGSDNEDDESAGYDAFSSGIPASINSESMGWGPMDGGRDSIGRPASSTYTRSPNVQSSVYASSRGVPSSVYPSSLHPPSSIYPQSTGFRDSDIPDVPDLPIFKFQNAERPLTHWPNGDDDTPTIQEVDENSRPSSQLMEADRPLTLWPQRDVDSRASQRGTSAIIREYYAKSQEELAAAKRGNINSDMSWLNLGQN